ncbi:MAG: hypothetical protein QM669_12385 [Siphonobacter sp.]
MNQKGNNWAAFGKKNTGKTYEVMALARYFNERKYNPKRIIVFDHSQNSSYDDITKVIPIKRLQYALPKQDIVKVQDTDFDLFAEMCLLYVRNSVVVIDDSSAYFRGNVNDIRLRLLKSPKNNGNEYMFQCHSVGETAPRLLENIDMFILKETREDPNDLPGKLPGRNRIAPLIRYAKEANRELLPNQKWTTVVYDGEEDVVWVKDLSVKSENVLDTYILMAANDVFND